MTLSADCPTRVELLHLEGKIERWIRFGHVAHEEILDRRRRALWFAAGSVFAFVRWAAGDFGTVRGGAKVGHWSGGDLRLRAA